MANTSDGSGKGPPKPGSDNQPKKPSAILDLKATEIDIRDPRKDAPGAGAAAKAAATAASGGAAAPAPGAASGTPAAKSAVPAAGAPTKPTSGTAAGGATEAKPSGGKPGETRADGRDAAKPDDKDDKSAGKPHIHAVRSGAETPTQRPAAPPPSGGGLRTAATHLAAGLAGGLVALFGADALAPQLGLTGAAPPAQVSPEVGRRLQALEAAAARPQAGVPADIAQKLAAAEARLAELERLGGTVGELTQAQTRLAGETRTLAERLKEAGADTTATADARIAKLEETLALLSAAAASDSQRGRIPQLAAISARIADLETSVTNQITALRRSVTQEVDSRLTRSAEASEAARTGTQRLDRELAGVKTEAVQLAQRLDTLKAATDRFEVTLRGIRDEASQLKAEVAGVQADVSRELKQVARPQDVNTALSPVATRLAALEQNVQGVVRSEDDRRANAERIVMALEVGNLKRTVERGAPFSAELGEVRRIAGPRLDLSALERFKDRGVPTLAELEREFRGLAHAVIEADSQPVDAHWADRLLAGAKSIVRVRKVDQSPDDKSIEAGVARMEASLKGGRLVEVAAEASKLPPHALKPARAWLDKIEARAAVDLAISSIERELKAALGAAPAASPKADKKG